MARNPVLPTKDGEYESHNAWGLIGASRVSSGAPGAILFDSDIPHQHFVMVRLRRATRRRNLMRDWIHGDRQEIIEIAMSEAQWASFVSSMNVGEGVPCTIERVEGERMDELPYEPRLAESMDEVRSAGEKVLSVIRDAFKTYQEHHTKANLKRLESAIANADNNMVFAAESLNEHAENVVQKARADIEAIVVSKAEQLGIDPADVGDTPLLGRENNAG